MKEKIKNNSFYIGNLLIPGRFVLAPMAGFTNNEFRQIAYKYGANLVYSEMISDIALIHNNKATYQMIGDLKKQGIVAVQLFGSSPVTMAQAAKIVANMGAHIIDINYGCPVNKVVKSGAGSALLLNLDQAEAIAKAVVEAVSIPVTAKIRLGFDNSLVAVELAKRLESVGIKAIAVHGRTRKQFYSGNADWLKIKEVKEAVRIPVIGNGDIKDAYDAIRMLETTGVDAVMIGRAAVGNPFIFTNCQQAYNHEEIIVLNAMERIKLAIEHFEMLSTNSSNENLVHFRGLGCAYIKGFPNSSFYRNKIVQATTSEEFITIFKDIIASMSVD